MPDDFWDADLIKDALASWHMGRVIAAYRNHPFHGQPLHQEVVGGWVVMTQPQLSRLENGPPIKDLDKLILWARTLRIPSHLLWFKLPEDAVGESVKTTGSHSNSRSGPEVGKNSTRVSFQTIPARGAVLPSASGDASAMRSFRVADRQIGGGHLYATVVNYLHDEIGPRLFDSGDSSDGQRLFTAAAALTEMAGWMAHDAGRHASAGQHFGRAFDLVKVGGNSLLSAHILASMSHLAHHLGQPQEAIQLARRGREALRKGPPQPALKAQLFAAEAPGFAALRRADECKQLLVEAEKALSYAQVDEPSEWISPFDEASLASDVARCMRQLGDLSETKRQAERIIALRPRDRTRSRAFGQLILVTVLIAQGKPDEACAVARDVLDATHSLGSCLVIQQLLDLRPLLKPYGANPVVADFLICLEEALRERIGLYQWLTKDVRRFPMDEGEEM